MALIDDVGAICQRLAPAGWKTLMQRHGLDLTSPNPGAELKKELPDINRRIVGFEDFANEGKRGVEPGMPARSLLYHALASPDVVEDGTGRPLRVFPTLSDLETVENYVYGVRPPSLADLKARANGGLLAIVVFAYEYRPGRESVHRRHADNCFSRTGVARVGTADAAYNERSRGFQPFADDSDSNGIRVLPSRFAPYVAVQHQGDDEDYGPMQFKLRQSNPQLFGSSDENRLFWIPLHKLFSGTECIQGLNLDVNLEAHHMNEKLRRIHLQLAALGHPALEPPEIDQPPFRFSEGIAEWSSDSRLGSGVLVPVAHPNLVAAAARDGTPVTFSVPPNQDSGLGPSLTIASEEGFRHAPEFVHVRHAVGADGTVRDLNDQPEVLQAVLSGGYQALHYIDFAGDGFVRAQAPELATDIPRNVPAYSVVTAPDFYPNCDQRELIEWWVQVVPTALRDGTWSTPPLTLSDERLAPNIELPDVDFRPEDDTVTAIVSQPLPGPVRPRRLPIRQIERHTHLPDSAAGVFAPGWDTSRDRTNGVAHLAAYGLGSPFPEDAKLCAALSTFWPAAAPDAGRSFSRTFPTVSPMTDEEIGSVGDSPWDGVAGPKVVGDVVDYPSYDHVDYVHQALEGRFSVALTGKVGVEEYKARVLAMARVYLAAGIQGPEEREWMVASFRAAAPRDPLLLEAQAEAGTRLANPVFAVQLLQRGNERPDPNDHRRVHVEIGERIMAFVGALAVVLVRHGEGPWNRVTTP